MDDPHSSTGPKRAIFYALGANAGIALSKAAAALITGSGAIGAEAIHSLADCANQVLLLLGLKEAQTPESRDHPLGHHRVVYFWSMMVALLLFFGGGAFSVYQGWTRFTHPEPLKHTGIALGVVILAVLLEGWSLRGAMKASARERRGKSLWRWFRETRESELLIVTGEDLAALAGLALAGGAVILSLLTGDPRWDAGGSIGVGVLLMVTAAMVLREIKSLMVGESASPLERAKIRAFLEQRPEIKTLIRLITLQWGPKLVVAIQAEMVPYPSANALVDAINLVEDDLRRAFPSAEWVFFEPERNKDVYELPASEPEEETLADLVDQMDLDPQEESPATAVS